MSEQTPGLPTHLIERKAIDRATPFFRRVPRPGLPVGISENGHALLPVPPPALAETFVRVPFPPGALSHQPGCLHEEGHQWYIDLPVGQDEAGFFYSYDWAIPVLAASGVAGIKAVCALLRDWAQHSNSVKAMLGRPLDVADLLVAHPHTHRSAWRIMLQSLALSDTNMIGLFKNRGLLRTSDADPLARTTGVLDAALIDQRPYLADFLWRHGGRPSLPASLFFTAIPNPWLYARNLGSPSDPMSRSQMERVCARGAYAGLSVANAVAHAGATWRTRFHEVLAGAPPPRFVVERHEGGAVFRESWGLPAWLIHHSNLASLPNGALTTMVTATPDMQEVLQAERIAWLRWAMAHGCRTETDPQPIADAVPAERLAVEVAQRNSSATIYQRAHDCRALLEATMKNEMLSAPAISRPRRHA